MATLYTARDLVAGFLNAHRVNAASRIISAHCIPMLDALERYDGVRFGARPGEHEVCHMAVGGACATDRLGVLFDSTSPGSAEAMGGLRGARLAGVPLPHIPGQASTKSSDRGVGTAHDTPARSSTLRGAHKTVYPIRTAQEAFDILSSAAVEALAVPCAPVNIEVPIDIQHAGMVRRRRPTHFHCRYQRRSRPPRPRSSAARRQCGQCCGQGVELAPTLPLATGRLIADWLLQDMRRAITVRRQQPPNNAACGG